VAYLDANALGTGSGSKAEPCTSGDALAGVAAPSDACP
jgi:ethanolamine ammonia-lyase large subunit